MLALGLYETKSPFGKGFGGIAQFCAIAPFLLKSKLFVTILRGLYPKNWLSGKET
jgi:hypothetical protein